MRTTDDHSHTDLINALIATEKSLAQIHAAQIRLPATLASTRDADPLDCTEEEITAALRWSPTTTRTRLHTDPHTYKPTASVHRLVRLRDRHCTFPGCAMPATRCDLNHIVAFNHHRPEAGGASIPENLHALCRRHHRLKTAGTWTVQRGSEGETVWSAPTAHRYVARAETYAA